MLKYGISLKSSFYISLNIHTYVRKFNTCDTCYVTGKVGVQYLLFHINTNLTDQN